ncbi:MAG TPA: nucleotidyl transferase AbiEii/AbiGii toxin family protein [Pseudobdellovibrionaceae bacterium]
MINLRKTLTEAHSILEQQGVSHALIGGFALAVYGQHRATVDIDFLADGGKKELIKTSLLAKGFVLKHESPEVLQFSGMGFVDIVLANRPLSQEMLKQALKNTELGVYVVRPEDIVGLKIQAYKNDQSRELQDKADIQRLLKMPNLDFTLIKKYADLFQEWPEIEKLRGQKS